MRKALVLALTALGLVLGAAEASAADEPVVPHASPWVPWSPVAADCRGLLWNDWSPAFYPGIYQPGWGGWWYMYFGHSYSPFYSPRLHEQPFCHYSHPYYNYPLAVPALHPAPVSVRPQPARVVVTLPADARLLVNGVETDLTSARREFTTPELKPGKDYFYILRVEVLGDGAVKILTQEAAVFAGRECRVHFDAPTPATAQK